MRQHEPRCDLCDDTGTITWQQPVPGEDGAFVLTEMNHPCVNGCSGWRRLPAAESGTVVDPDGGGPAAGNVADANRTHRTEWFRPTSSGDDDPP
ncbi:hypothetical protein ACVDFE_30980 [Lentzea chajnantorensis]